MIAADGPDTVGGWKRCLIGMPGSMDATRLFLCCSCIFRILLFLFVSFALSVESSLLGLVHRLLVAKGLMVECVDRSIQTDKALTAGRTTQRQEEKEQTKNIQ